MNGFNHATMLAENLTEDMSALKQKNPYFHLNPVGKGYQESDAFSSKASPTLWYPSKTRFSMQKSTYLILLKA